MYGEFDELDTDASQAEAIALIQKGATPKRLSQAVTGNRLRAFAQEIGCYPGALTWLKKRWGIRVGADE